MLEKPDGDAHAVIAKRIADAGAIGKIGPGTMV